MGAVGTKPKLWVHWLWHPVEIECGHVCRVIDTDILPACASACKFFVWMHNHTPQVKLTHVTVAQLSPELYCSGSSANERLVPGASLFLCTGALQVLRLFRDRDTQCDCHVGVSLQVYPCTSECCVVHCPQRVHQKLCRAAHLTNAG